MAGGKGKAVDLVRIQVSVTIERQPGHSITSEFLEAAMRQWVDTGSAPRGIRIDAIEWKHGSHRGKADQKSTLEDVRQRLGRVLRAGNLSFLVGT